MCWCAVKKLLTHSLKFVIFLIFSFFHYHSKLHYLAVNVCAYAAKSLKHIPLFICRVLAQCSADYWQCNASLFKMSGWSYIHPTVTNSWTIIATMFYNFAESLVCFLLLTTSLRIQFFSGRRVHIIVKFAESLLKRNCLDILILTVRNITFV